LFDVKIAEDAEYKVILGGTKGKVVVWNTENVAQVRKEFRSKQFGSEPASAEPKKEVVQVEEEEEVESEGDWQDDEVMEEDFEEEDGDHV
jgi:periodic tryptophan protein 1